MSIRYLSVFDDLGGFEITDDNALAVYRLQRLRHPYDHLFCIRQHTSAYVSIRQHTSAYVSIYHLGFGLGVYVHRHLNAVFGKLLLVEHHAQLCVSVHTSAYVSIRQHTSAYVSIRQHALAS